MQHGLSAAAAIRSSACAPSTSLSASDLLIWYRAFGMSRMISRYQAHPASSYVRRRATGEQTDFSSYRIRSGQNPGAFRMPRPVRAYLPLPVRRLTRHFFSLLGNWGAWNPDSTHVRLQSHKKPSGSILRARAGEMTTKNHAFKHLARPSLFAHPPR
jgi:hypothetical protein